MIEIVELTKRYGRFTAVNGISFRVDRGEVLGFLGPNGAGKSTTMRMITGYIPPTQGRVAVGGMDTVQDALAVRKMIGYLPENAPSYGELTVAEYLRFIAEMRGFKRQEQIARVAAVMELTTLSKEQNQLIETLSKGFRQRVCFAQALIHDPPVLILDEPTDGLDPNQKHELRRVIRRMGETKTIVLSTHILEEMEAVCTRALIIARGRIAADGTPASLAARSPYHNAVLLHVRAEDAARSDDLRKIPGVKSVEKLSAAPANTGEGASSVRLRLFSENGRTILDEVHRYLREHRLEPLEIHSEQGRVDEVFRVVTGVAAEQEQK